MSARMWIARVRLRAARLLAPRDLESLLAEEDRDRARWTWAERRSSGVESAYLHRDHLWDLGEEEFYRALISTPRKRWGDLWLEFNEEEEGSYEKVH